jgi:uncharacterized protein DUF4126
MLADSSRHRLLKGRILDLMMNLLSAVLGVSFAAGLNAYATVLALGLMQRFEVIHLPRGLEVLGSLPVIAAAGLLYLVEFVADKVPYIDSIWDGIHTVIRPLAGAVLAYGVVGNVDPQWQVIAALVGGSVALTSHTAKASARATVNLSPEPFSNWFLSLAEDALSFLLVWLTAVHPFIGMLLVLVLAGSAVYVVWKLSHFARRVFGRT